MATTTGNREWQAVGPDTVKFTYNASKQLSGVVDAEGNTTTLGYDSQGNLISEILPASTQTWTHYHRDARGYDTLTATATGNPTGPADSVTVATKYDVLGRVQSTYQESFDSMAVFNEIVIADPMWVRTRHTYDPGTGYRVRTEAWGGITATDSTTTGLSEWVYDGLGRVIVEKRPAGRDSLVYDAASNVVTRYLKSDFGTPFTVTMSYDALNRPTQRTVPAQVDTTASINGIQFPYYSTPGLSVSGSTVTVHGDTETFDYDVMGNLTQADNRYARIRRTYLPNGAIKADTLRLRNYADSTVWSTHVYGLRHDYNKDGQDSLLYHPDWINSTGTDQTKFNYSTTTGRLTSVLDAFGSTYSFTYNGNGQPTLISLPSGSRTITYDAAGHVDTFAGTAISRDRAGRILGADNNLMDYNGFGHLVYAEITTPGYPSIETFDRDAFGNAMFSQVRAAEGPHTASTGHFSTAGGRMWMQQGSWHFEEHPEEPTAWVPDATNYAYDERGNLGIRTEWRYAWDPDGPVGDPWDEVRRTATHEHNVRSYYSADDRLMVHQITRDSTEHRYDANGVPIGDFDGDPWGAFEEYWYDALGRRVLKRTRQDPPVCEYTASSPRCYSAIERYVWNGDQLLWELRQDDAGDTQNPTNGTHTGEIGYIHAGGIDQPLGMMRNGATVVLHPNWRGLFDGSTPWFPDVPWPGGSWRASQNDMDPREVHTWVGSLAMGQADHSGLHYRRNRYYDPGSGQFTQQDPIGIAGGINLYGYANGDPVNFSDPFGLRASEGCDELWDWEDDSTWEGWADCMREEYEREDREEQEEAERQGRIGECRGARLEGGARFVLDAALAVSYAYGASLIARGGLAMAVGATEAGVLAGGTSMTSLAVSGTSRMAVGAGTVMEGVTTVGSASSLPGVSAIPGVNSIGWTRAGGLSACQGL